MNQNQQQQSSDGRHDDDAAHSDFLASLMDYTPTVTLLSLSLSLKFEFIVFYIKILMGLYWILLSQIPDELVEHYLAKSGFQCPDVRLYVLFIYLLIFFK